MINEVTDAELQSCIGRVIHNGSIEILTAPALYDGEYRCLANVSGALCVIAVTITKKDHGVQRQDA